MGLHLGNEAPPTVHGNSAMPSQNDKTSCSSSHDLLLGIDSEDSNDLKAANAGSVLRPGETPNAQKIETSTFDTAYPSAEIYHHRRHELVTLPSLDFNDESLDCVVKPQEIADGNLFLDPDNTLELTDDLQNFALTATPYSVTDMFSDSHLCGSWHESSTEMPGSKMDSGNTLNPRVRRGEVDPAAAKPKKKVRFQAPEEDDPYSSSSIYDLANWLAVSRATNAPLEQVNRSDVWNESTNLAKTAVVPVSQDTTKARKDLQEAKTDQSVSHMLLEKAEPAPAYFFDATENYTQDIRADLRYLGVDLDGWIDVNLFDAVSVFRREMQQKSGTHHFATGLAQVQTRQDDIGVFRLVLRDVTVPQRILVVALVPGTCIVSPPDGGLVLSVRNYTAGSARPVEWVMIQTVRWKIEQMHAALRQAIAQSVF